VSVADPLNPVFVSNTPTANAAVTDTLSLSTSTGQLFILGSVNPSSGLGIVAPEGSIFLSSIGLLYTKTGAGATAWTEVGALPGGSSGDVQLNVSGAFGNAEGFDTTAQFSYTNAMRAIGGTDGGQHVIAAGPTSNNSIALDGNAFSCDCVETGAQVQFEADSTIEFESNTDAVDFTAATIISFTAPKYNVNALQIFANNAAAISGGLAAGDLYRTGANPDPVCVVH
jgi:hypothetical protein